MPIRLLALFLLAATLVAADPRIDLHDGFVSVSVAVERVVGDRAELVARFTPDANDPPLHLYSKDLVVGQGGFPTRLDLPPGSSLEALAPLEADLKPFDLNGLPVYPDGPVTLRLAVRLPEGPVGSLSEAEVRVTYMACTPKECKRPVRDRAISILIPAHPRAPSVGVDRAAVAAAVASALDSERPRLVAEIDAAATRRLAAERMNSGGIRFRSVATVDEVDAVIKATHAEDRSVILDFTGPSCTVCQTMARSVLRDPRAIAAWNAQVPIEIDTDAHGELADWQTARFHTQSRPLYIRIDPNGTEERWSRVFDAKDPQTMAAFLVWSAGGAGADIGEGGGWLAFLLLAVGGGLFTLVMPCTYPMIPFTVNFFAKQASNGRSLLPLAAFYAGGIVVCFIVIGALLAGLLKANPAQLSGNPWTNLVFATVFLLLGLSLIGTFLLRLPAALENAMGGGRGGYLGALGMGLTFVLTAFACTAPFAGVVLGGIASTGGGEAWVRMVVGMAVYGLTIGIPFFLLSLSPALLKRLPKAGSWMNEFKVVGGLVEMAAAFKFLNIADHAWGWGIFGRDAVFSLWAVCAALVATYVLGRWRMASDQPVVSVGAGRLILCGLFAALALWLASGVFGNDLGQIESFLAPEG